ncbi:hypothetical protein FSP39_017068 [Pinctada imbricata]|uniref:SWIM-type domain-containing protein n=1 Tax=Pinctada imbricata TaxID=66713 RepID=A0AA89C7M4_PINIB|nr:hypothetical protein FSP39_017068 [Pinctada imbricata]
MWKPKGNLRFPTRFQVVSIVETSSYTGLQGMETKRKLEVSNPIPSGFHRGNRAVSAFQTHGNHWFPLWKPGGNHMETPGFHVVSTRFPRDALPFLSSLGINAEMPAFMKKGETQMSTEDANCSRLVTKIRWVVESANARIKRWRFLDRTLTTNQIPFIREYIRIVCAISNKYFRPLSNGNEDEDQVLAAKMAYLSRQVNWLQSYVEEKGFHKKTAQWREIDRNDDFPSLDEDQIRQLTCGTYQMKLCASYAQEHMDGNCDISVHKDEPTLLRVRIQSRHCSSKSYMLRIKYNEACVEAWYCRCRAGSRVVGVCAHIAAVIWHLGYSRHSQRRVGVQNWGKYLMDAACVPEEVIDASDSDTSEDEFPEE